MKKLLLIVACTFAGTAFASVAENKAKKESDQKFADAATKAKTACGNSALTTSIDWDAYEKIDTGTTPKEQALGWAGGYATWLPEHMASLCGKDADYKAEIAKITKLVASPMLKGASMAKVSKSGSTLTITFNPTGGNDSDVESTLKKAF